MATIYRFIVEQQQGGGSSGRKNGSSTKKSAKDKTFTMMNTQGVEHNRKLRAINPLLNKAIPGFEKYMRLGRAGLGLLKFKKDDAGNTVFAGFSGVSIAIIVNFLVQSLIRFDQQVIQQNEKLNKQNYRKMETGENAVHNAYKVTTYWFTGKRTYNENK